MLKPWMWKNSAHSARTNRTLRWIKSWVSGKTPTAISHNGTMLFWRWEGVDECENSVQNLCHFYFWSKIQVAGRYRTWAACRGARFWATTSLSVQLSLPVCFCVCFALLNPATLHAAQIKCLVVGHNSQLHWWILLCNQLPLKEWRGAEEASRVEQAKLREAAQKADAANKAKKKDKKNKNKKNKNKKNSGGGSKRGGSKSGGGGGSAPKKAKAQTDQPAAMLNKSLSASEATTMCTDILKRSIVKITIEVDNTNSKEIKQDLSITAIMAFLVVGRYSLIEWQKLIFIWREYLRKIS